MASFATEPSGPGVPELRLAAARRLVRRLTSAWTQSWVTRSRCDGVVGAVLRVQVSTSWPIGPEPFGGVPPPIDTRSFISVVIDTAQPRPDVVEAHARRGSGRR